MVHQTENTFTRDSNIENFKFIPQRNAIACSDSFKSASFHLIKSPGMPDVRVIIALTDD
jgi:hypothetical protein